MISSRLYSWIELIKLNQEMMKSDIRKMNYKVYKWIYKNDRVWLNENPPKADRYSFGLIDSKEKDLYMRNTLEKVVKEIKGKDDRSIRITKSLLTRVTNLSTIERNKLDRFPQTKAFIEKTVETYEDFYLKKIDWACCHLESKLSFEAKEKVYFKKGKRSYRTFSLE